MGQNQESIRCVNGNGTNLWSEDIPGSMAASKYRRMIVGSFGWQQDNTNATDCLHYDLDIKIVFEPDARSDHWTFGGIFTLHVNKETDPLGIEVSDNSTRLRVDAVILPNPWNTKQSIVRLILSDGLEDTCYEALEQTKCLKYANEPGKKCDECALLHKRALKAGNCTGGQRMGTVVNYWCGCGSDDDCGGPPPQ